MGALAITTLAGARLMLSSKSWEILHDFQPFIGGFTLFFWATGTWWIPLLVIVGFWRHVVDRVPVTYYPHYWSLVFPLGMYTVPSTPSVRLLIPTLHFPTLPARLVVYPAIGYT